MPEEENVEQSAAEPQEAQAPAETEAEELLPPEEQARREARAAAAAEEEKKNNRIAAVLTMLICLCLIAEVALGSYIGLTLYQNHQNQQLLAARYDAYLQQLEAQRADPPKVQYIGPSVRVVDGVLVEDYPSAYS